MASSRQVPKWGCCSKIYRVLKDIYLTFSYGIRVLDSPPGDMMIGVRVLAGLTTGGLSVVLAQPTDVVKIKMQAQKTSGPPLSIIYKNSLQAYSKIAREEGVQGLWKGIL